MQFQIQNRFIKATFNLLGAELISLKSSEKEYIWEGNPEFWSRHSPMLFPIIGELKNGSYLFEGKEYRLPRHGFARAKEFEVIQQLDNSITFSLKSDSETLKVYPFHFELQIEYLLVENKLEVHYKVENRSQEKMYFSIGGHPAFALSENFENYSLLFETSNELEFKFLEDNLLSDKSQLLETNNNHLSLNYQLFEKDALVFKNHQIQSVTIKEFSKDLLKVSFEGFPDLGIWTKPTAAFICIEPWFGHADMLKTTQNFKEKAGIQLLEKDASFTAIYTVEIFK
jgi:galactose mutarotase-like enzyme